MRILVARLIAVFSMSIAAAQAEPTGWWRMEGFPGASITGQVVKSEITNAVLDGIARADSGGKIELRGEVAGQYVYDPVSGTSCSNTTSLSLSDNGTGSAFILIPFDPVKITLDSFTLELFAKANAEQRTKDGDILPLFRKTKKDNSAATFELHVSRSHPPHGYNWLQASVAAPWQHNQELAGNQYGGVAHITDGKAWRHLALTYDHAANKVRYYCDYELLATVAQTSSLAVLDAGPILIGGQPGNRGFSGLIDEVRLSKGALEPWNFLRVASNELKNVSFKAEKAALPPDSGCINVKLRFGAVGDGVTDDTAAIQKAFRECADKAPMQYNTLYFPAGVYVVSDSCRWTRFMTVRGDGRDKTIFRLKDNCAGFTNSAKPKAVIIASNWNGGQGSGSAIGNHGFDFGVNVGSGNSGAIGLQFNANNQGGMDGVIVRSGDSSGTVGLDFTRPWPGPSLQKNIRIEGFDIGVRIAHREQSLVFENVELVGQKVAGIRNDGNSVSIRHLISSNSAPAIVNAGAGGMVVVLDGNLGGGAANTCAIENKGSLYARNIKVAGYKAAVKNAGSVIEGCEIKEHVVGKIQMMFDSPKSSLNLPVHDTPDPAIDDPATWVNVLNFSDKAKDGDWADALQAAVDSGATTLYFPANTRCEIRKTIQLRGNVRRLVGMRSGIYGKPDTFKDTPMVSIGGSNKCVIVMDMLDIGTDYGARVFALEHTGPQTVVLKHADICGYRTGPGVGPLFVEDMAVGSLVFGDGQKVWIRQLSLDVGQRETGIINNGADLWILGLKTECASINIMNNKGARTEILGGLIYPVANVPDGMPMFQNNDGAFSVVIAESCYSRNYDIVVKDTREGDTKNFMIKDANWEGGRAKLDLYVSNPEKL